MLKLVTRPAVVAICIGMLYLLTGISNSGWIKDRYPIQYDVNGYYLYLPAVFIYNDIHFRFVDQNPHQFDRKYFLYPTSKGGYLNKYPPGVAFFYLPFFLVAHGISWLAGLDTSGYSPLYRLSVIFSNVFFGAAALWLLSRWLARYFSTFTVNVTVASVGLATNYFFYTSWVSGLTHVYLFFLFVLIIIHTDGWLQSGKWQHLMWICVALGWATMIRPTEILVGVVPAWLIVRQLYLNKFKRFGHFIIRQMLPGLAVFFAMLMPLFIYWKLATGHWLHYSYEQEGFYFDRPEQIIYGLFGFRKGWFVYTPIALFFVAGIFTLQTSPFKHWQVPIGIYALANIYVVLSWWCWWYGGCFGQRAFIPMLAILSLPFASLVEQVVQYKHHLKGLTLAVWALFTFFNIFQSLQYKKQLIHHDGMSWQAYKYTFLKIKLSDAEWRHYKSLILPANYKDTGKKLSEYFTPKNDSTGAQ